MSTWAFDHATINRVIDGDTIEIDIDLGFEITKRGSFRLLGINAIELSKPGGQEAKANLAALLPQGTGVTLQSIKVDKYGGRYDAAITTSAGDLSAILISTGWAAPWNGTGKAPTPAWPRET